MEKQYFPNIPHGRPSVISGELGPMTRRKTSANKDSNKKEDQFNNNSLVHNNNNGGRFNQSNQFENYSIKNSNYQDDGFSLFGGADKNSLSKAPWNCDEVSTRSRKNKIMMNDNQSREGISNFDQNDTVFDKKPDPQLFPQNLPPQPIKPTQDTSNIAAPTNQVQMSAGLFAATPGGVASGNSYLRKRRPATTFDFSSGTMNQTQNKKETLDVLTKQTSSKIKKGDPKRNEKGGLLGMVLLMFQNREIYVSDIQQLNMDDKIVLQSLLKRKFSIDIDHRWENDNITERIN